MDELFNYLGDNYSPEQNLMLTQALTLCGKLIVNYEISAIYDLLYDQSIDNANKKDLIYNAIKQDMLDILAMHYITLTQDVPLSVMINMVITIDAIGGTTQDDNLLKILEGEDTPSEKWAYIVNSFTGEDFNIIASGVEVMPLLIDKIYQYITNAEDILSNVLDKSENLKKSIYKKLKAIEAKTENTIGVVFVKQNIPPFQNLNYYFSLLGKYRDMITDLTPAQAISQVPNIASIYLHSGEVDQNLTLLVDNLFKNKTTKADMINAVKAYVKDL